MHDGIKSIGTNGAPAIPTLVNILRTDSKASMGSNAAAAIGNIGPQENQSETIKALIEALNEQSEEVSAYAAVALSRINAPVIIEIQEK